MTSSRVSELFTHIAEEEHHSSVKVTVVGTGQVGMASAFAMLTQVSWVDYSSVIIFLII